MNPAAALLWLKDNWQLVLVLALVAALGVQSYRLLDAQRERDLLSQAQEARKKQDALAALANLRNKERTDEEYVAARRRAALVRVVPDTTATVTLRASPAPSGDGAAYCVDRAALDAQLTVWAQRATAGLGRLLAGVVGRNAERLGVNAREGEELSAAYRACRAFALNLVAPGEGSAGDDVGGGVHDGPSPASR